ncbi:DUF2806 domain-containing protein [Lusitaniella coriacea LEGE 07157]|uniref:DUF2806 domain-containing protein n=1 Tax=Lusitaniella coriacea LEGE 07157 TaxID=945747 RepID=A0A8J7J662_9CYAN|nr:DUF2806 domain-containing protein [Lusitaniella coriacea]MBE9118489.1 DUF2806 domain-containing protein [Lusitaniella coriacea LEGE 07157]
MSDIEKATSAFIPITGDVSDLVANSASLPAPIRKNIFKAFDRLCTATLDFPVAYLEGKAAERRAETQARIHLISANAKQIARQMNVDPEYGRIASDKYGKRILQEQINIDTVCNIAAQEIAQPREDLNDIGSSDQSDQTEVLISDDWLDSFQKEACGKSSEEMQILFGRILAEEIKKPNSFAIRTVKIMGQLDSKPARLFRQLCSLSVTLGHGQLIIDARVPSLGKNAATNSLQEYGLGFSNLNILEEYGLIISDYNSYMNYIATVARNNLVSLPLRFNNVYWGLVPNNPDDWPPTREIRIQGVTLSNSGKELLKIVEIESNKGYTEALINYFKGLGMELIRVNNVYT